MQIKQLFNWPAATWPATSAATQYAVFQVYPVSLSPTIVATTATNSVTLTLDDSQNLAYQVRPTDGTNYGPEVAVITVNYVPCRAWLRENIRFALSDRLAAATTAGPTWPDSEIDQYIGEALSEFNVLFPIENQASITLLPPIINSNGISEGVRIYNLPADFFYMRKVEYLTSDGKLDYYLKEKPFRGGESSSTTYVGYPKLGILKPPIGGRYYPGHYEIYQDQLVIDFDPTGVGEKLTVYYLGRRPLPTSDADIMNVTPEDMAILSLGAQVKCWLRVEAQDTRLSRWRDKTDGSRRDDMPTLRHSQVIKQFYDQRVNDRREQRPKVRRLVRR